MKSTGNIAGAGGSRGGADDQELRIGLVWYSCIAGLDLYSCIAGLVWYSCIAGSSARVCFGIVV
jgi:hypothetical protein